MRSYLDENEPDQLDGIKDEEILKQSLNEPALFEMLVEKYHEPLMRAAWRVVRNRQEAEDIIQEAFVKMYKNAHKFEKMEGIEFKSWAYKVTINTAITHYRKLKRGEFLSEDPTVYEESPGPLSDEPILLKSDARAAVASALADMPPHLRSVLEHYYLEDKSYQAIAHEEGITISTLKMRLFRAKKLFKKITQQKEV